MHCTTMGKDLKGHKEDTVRTKMTEAAQQPLGGRAADTLVTRKETPATIQFPPDGRPLLLHGDGLAWMDALPAGCASLLLSDMPYGTTKCKWDCQIPLEAFWKKAWRILKPNGAVLLWAQPPFDKALAMSNIQQFRYEWIVEKTRATGFLNVGRMPLKAHENVLVFYRRLPVYHPQISHGHARKCATAEQKAKTSMSRWEGYGTYE